MTLERLAAIMSIAVAIQVLLSILVSLLYRYSRNQSVLDLAELKLSMANSQQAQQSSMAAMQAEILERIDRKLDQRFRDYSELHMKEHGDIHRELLRLRDWKHETADPMMRKHDANISDLVKDVDELKDRYRDK